MNTNVAIEHINNSNNDNNDNNNIRLLPPGSGPAGQTAAEQKFVQELRRWRNTVQKILSPNNMHQIDQRIRFRNTITKIRLHQQYYHQKNAVQQINTTEASSILFGSNKTIIGLNVLVSARKSEGRGFVELEIFERHHFNSIPPTSRKRAGGSGGQKRLRAEGSSPRARRVNKRLEDGS